MVGPKKDLTGLIGVAGDKPVRSGGAANTSHFRDLAGLIGMAGEKPVGLVGIKKDLTGLIGMAGEKPVGLVGIKKGSCLK